jgi:ubiquinone biosynthesis protein UbiJ
LNWLLLGVGKQIDSSHKSISDAEVEQFKKEIAELKEMLQTLSLRIKHLIRI